MPPDHTQNSTLIELERTLKQELHAIEPNQLFISKLRTHLEESAIPDHQRRIAGTLLTIAGGLFAGLVIFLIGKGFLRQSNQT